MIARTTKIFIVLLLALLALTFFAGCSDTTQQEADVPDESPDDVNGDGDTFSVIDMAGREVDVPKNIETIAVLGIPSNFIVALGEGDKIVAMGFVTDFAKKVTPELANAGTVGSGQVDLEALAKFNPDIYFQTIFDKKGLEGAEELGIPTIVINAEDIDGIYETIELMGKVLGVEEKAQEQIAYYNEKVEFANSITENIAEEDKKTAIVMGIEIGEVASSTMLQSFLIETAGGINPVGNIDSDVLWPVVGVEKIFDWDPDFIFCSNSAYSGYTIEDIMDDPTMADLTAVKNGQVLRVPSDNNSWEHPGVGTALGFLWMMHQMYPELYGEDDFVEDVDSFYETIYGISLDREWLGY